MGPTCGAVQRNWFRVTWSCALFLALSSLPSNAQSPSLEVPPSTTVKNSTISVRALQIAQDAGRRSAMALNCSPQIKLPQAFLNFSARLRFFPEFYEVQYKIGLGSVNLHRYQYAQAAFEAFIELSKGRYPPSPFGLAVALCAQKQYSEAEDEEAVRAGLDQVPADAAQFYFGVDTIQRRDAGRSRKKRASRGSMQLESRQRLLAARSNPPAPQRPAGGRVRTGCSPSPGSSGSAQCPRAGPSHGGPAVVSETPGHCASRGRNACQKSRAVSNPVFPVRIPAEAPARALHPIRG